MVSNEAVLRTVKDTQQKRKDSVRWLVPDPAMLLRRYKSDDEELLCPLQLRNCYFPILIASRV